MEGQIWSWVLTIIGVTGFWLAGRKVWWCWYINIANQVLWATYAFVTEQWGFLIGVGFYLFVFVKNAIEWTRDHRVERDALRKKERREQIIAAVKSGVMSVNEVRRRMPDQ